LQTTDETFASQLIAYTRVCIAMHRLDFIVVMRGVGNAAHHRVEKKASEGEA
jgi:hypothetical protein